MMIAATILLWAIGAAQDDVVNAVPSALASDVSARVSVVFRCTDFDENDADAPPVYAVVLNKASFFPLDKSRHLGIKSALQAIEPMYRRHEKGGKALWCRFYIYIHNDGYVWGEVAVCNDSMTDPIGFVHGDLVVYLGNQQIAFRKDAGIFDQTGACIVLGAPRLAPDEELVRRAQRFFPDGVQLSMDTSYHSTLFHWGNRDPEREDHHPWTHKTGSPRNMYWPWELDGCWLYYFVHPPPAGSPKWKWVHRLSETMVQFSHEQLGTWFENGDGENEWFPGRTYHLYLYAPGQPPVHFDARKKYTFDQPDRPAHGRLGEGVIDTKLGRNASAGWKIETFGRIKMPTYHVENKALEGPSEKWLGHRISGQGYSGYKAIGGPNWGWDHEHHTNERLFAAAICTPSEIARTELINLARSTMLGVDGAGNTSDYYGCWNWGWRHSSRTLGWVGRMFWRTWMVTGDPVYRDMCRNMLRLWWVRGNDGRTGLEVALKQPATHKEAAFGFAHTRNSGATAGMWESQNNPVEACWQASVAAMFFWLMYEQEDDDKWRNMAKDAALYICEGVAKATLVDGGFVENYGIRWALKNGDPAFRAGKIGWLGTRHWCPDAMAIAAHVSGDDETYKLCRLAWEEYYLPRKRYPNFTEGHEYGHKWHRYCARFWGGWSDN